MANNIKVSFMAFSLGVFYGIGTFAVLVANGLMLGALAAVFAQHHLFAGFVTTVLIHGTLELFAIAVAGAAGLRFGQSIFRPGNLRRAEALMDFGLEAFQVCLVMVPVLVVAAILEGYVTPLHPPMAVRLAVIGASLALIGVLTTVPVVRYRRRRTPPSRPSFPAKGTGDGGELLA
jgi:uncharacterized membrane protein SpoIIM required for sporulation